MGKKHREGRKTTKAEFRRLGVREDELGEVKVRATKAEVRRQAVRRAEARQSAMWEILQLMQKQAHEDLCRAIDEEVFADIRAAFDTATVVGVLGA